MFRSFELGPLVLVPVVSEVVALLEDFGTACEQDRRHADRRMRKGVADVQPLAELSMVA